MILGLPLFGHTGEIAIRDWWANKGVVINPYQDHTECLLEFTNFDGIVSLQINCSNLE
jgi:hypothetical protein